MIPRGWTQGLSHWLERTVIEVAGELPDPDASH